MYFAGTVLRFVLFLAMLSLIGFSQRYWFIRAWRLAGRARRPAWQTALRAMLIAAFGLFAGAVVFNMVFNFALQFTALRWRRNTLTAWTGLWISSALFSYFAVQAVAGAAWCAKHVAALWRRVRIRFAPPNRVSTQKAHALPAPPDTTIAMGRRRFVQGATLVAGAVPFSMAGYGFMFARLRYQVRHVDLPIAALPANLAGMRIAQLSDIHIGSYLSGSDVRRAVEMTNELAPHLVVVTGDCLTGMNDPLETCIAELSRLRAPLGVWGCNGNHEIYARAEALSARLFARYGMRLLRQENVELVWHAQAFNMIGVDYQRQRRPNGNAEAMLTAIEPLVRRDVPNILLSHNPNSFRRAAELGIEVMLAGHTHGGQVRVEILDDRFSPARFLTPYVAGMYRRPLGALADLDDDAAWAGSSAGQLHNGAAVVYVNRGIGTIGAPVRLGVPPEITLHTLRSA